VLDGKTLTFVTGILQVGGGLILASLLVLRQPRQGDLQTTSRWSLLVLLLVALDLLAANWGGNPTADPWLYTQPTQTAAILRATGYGNRTFYRLVDSYAVTFASPEQTVEPAAEVNSVRRDGFLSFASFRPRQTEYWYGMREALVPNAGILDEIPSANNFDPLVSSRFLQLTDAIDKASIQDRLRLLRLMGVDTLVTKDPVPGLQPIHVTPDVVFSAVPDHLPRAYLVYSALPAGSPDEALELIIDPHVDLTRAVILEGIDSDTIRSDSASSGSVSLTATTNTVTIRAALPQDGYLVLLDTYYPGWQAYVDHRPAVIYPANLAFRAVKLSAGEHQVEFHYRPISFRNGALVTGLTCILFSILGTFRIVRNRRKIESRD
jgi:hypothetical protein